MATLTAQKNVSTGRQRRRSMSKADRARRDALQTSIVVMATSASKGGFTERVGKVTAAIMRMKYGHKAGSWNARHLADVLESEEYAALLADAIETWRKERTVLESVQERVDKSVHHKDKPAEVRAQIARDHRERDKGILQSLESFKKGELRLNLAKSIRELAAMIDEGQAPKAWTKTIGSTEVGMSLDTVVNIFTGRAVTATQAAA